MGLRTAVKMWIMTLLKPIPSQGQMYPPVSRNPIGEATYLTIRLEIRVGSLDRMILTLRQSVGKLSEKIIPMTARVGSTVSNSITFIEIMGNETVTEAKLKVRSLPHDISERLKELIKLKEAIG